MPGVSIIGPIVSFIFVVIRLITGVDFGSDFEGQVTTWTITGAAIAWTAVGIWKNHKKTLDKQKPNNLK